MKLEIKLEKFYNKSDLYTYLCTSWFILNHITIKLIKLLNYWIENEYKISSNVINYKYINNLFLLKNFFKNLKKIKTRSIGSIAKGLIGPTLGSTESWPNNLEFFALDQAGLWSDSQLNRSNPNLITLLFVSIIDIINNKWLHDLI